MKQLLDISSWSRRKHYHFFKTFDNPFFNVCVDIDVTTLLSVIKDDHRLSFFPCWHYAVARAANECDFMRYRIENDDVVVWDSVDVGAIVLRDDETFAFCYMEYTQRLDEFVSRAEKSIHDAESSEVHLETTHIKSDIIHCTVLPWFSFTSFSHARKYGIRDSVPKIASGKYTESLGRFKMPVSVEVHHALVDGLHVGRFYQKLQSVLDDESMWKLT